MSQSKYLLSWFLGDILGQEFLNLHYLYIYSTTVLYDSCFIALKDLSCIVKSHRNFDSISISINFIAKIKHTSKAKCVYKVYCEWNL